MLIFNFYESGSDLVVEGTGSLNLPSIPLFTGTCAGGVLLLDTGFCTGETPRSPLYIYDITGPTTLGAGIATTNAFSSSKNGIALGLNYSAGLFGIDLTYLSGTTISSSSTFTGITLASLGMPATGTLGTWTLLDPSDPTYIGDTISVKVNASSSGSPANVPGPLPLLGLGAAFGFSRRLRRLLRFGSKTSQPS